MAAAAFTAPSGILNLVGTETVTGGSFNANHGTVVVSAVSGGMTLNLGVPPSTNLTLTASNDLLGGALTVQGNLVVAGNATLGDYGYPVRGWQLPGGPGATVFGTGAADDAQRERGPAVLGAVRLEPHAEQARGVGDPGERPEQTGIQGTW